MWAWLVFTIVILVLALCIRNHSQQLDSRIKAVEIRLEKYVRTRKHSQSAHQRILKDIYHLLRKSLTDDNKAAAYKSAELLKLAFGSGVLCENEPAKLAGAVTIALRKGQFDAAGFMMNAFKPLVRTLPDPHLRNAFEQLAFICAVASRSKQGFIITKAMENIFLACGRIKDESPKEDVHFAVRAVRTCGMIALRRHDQDLFREINVRFVSWAISIKHFCMSSDYANLLVVWLNRITKYDHILLFNYWKETAEALVSEGALAHNEFGLLIDECANAAGTSALNPHSKLPAEYITYILNFTVKNGDTKTWLRAVHVTRRIGSLALSRYDMPMAFKIVHPLLDMGRKLMTDELRFWEYSDGRRKEQLFILLKECIMLVELKSRQDMTASSAEIIAELYRQWNLQPGIIGNQKSVKKFCQFFFLYWQTIKRRQAKRSMPLDNDISQPTLISENDRKRLGL